MATEALVRWRRPEHGMVGPDQFVHIAEEVGLIRELGTHVVGSARTSPRDRVVVATMLARRGVPGRAAALLLGRENQTYSSLIGLRVSASSC